MFHSRASSGPSGSKIVVTMRMAISSPKMKVMQVSYMMMTRRVDVQLNHRQEPRKISMMMLRWFSYTRNKTVGVGQGTYEPVKPDILTRSI